MSFRKHLVSRKIRPAWAAGCALLMLAFLHLPAAFAQTDATGGDSSSVAYVSPAIPGDPDPTILNTPSICGFRNLPQCLKDIGNDQLGIWSSPSHLKLKDAFWLAPFVAATAVTFHNDADISQDIGFHPATLNVGRTVSNFGSGYATVGFGGALWTIGTLTHHEHLAETGLLGLEAIADAFLVDEAIKLPTNRQRPYENLVERGQFWEHGTRGMTDSSFPSGHTITSFALARVVASEYPNIWVQVGAYSFATAVGLARITAQDHFPSDVLVGGALGYLIGGYVVHHHGSKAAGLISSINPVVNPATHTYAMGLQVNP